MIPPHLQRICDELAEDVPRGECRTYHNEGFTKCFEVLCDAAEREFDEEAEKAAYAICEEMGFIRGYGSIAPVCFISGARYAHQLSQAKIEELRGKWDNENTRLACVLVNNGKLQTELRVAEDEIARLREALELLLPTLLARSQVDRVIEALKGPSDE